MKTIHYMNFANGRTPQPVKVEFATLDVVVKHAKRGLSSKGVDAEYDENADLKTATCGTIFAGMRAVGRFRVIEDSLV